MYKQQSAFTLVELSIVLVILGLLIGGVLTGQSLIRAAELRSVSTQYNQFVTATQTFRDKYFALPGDMTNAQAYWGIANATPATCVTTASIDSKTCNGDGDGRVLASAGSHEPFRFWQHLANAGLIEGSYSGISVGGSYGTNATNAPRGKISSSFWISYNEGTMTTPTYSFAGQYDNVFHFAALAGTSPGNPVLKPEEAYNLDMKVDDGKPATGKVVIYANGGLNTCTDASAASTLTASYLLSSTAITCALFFRQAY